MLTLLTLTDPSELSKQRVYMNSVDTGWINDENPLHKAAAHQHSANFQTPLDEIDAAARVLDPIFHSVNEFNGSNSQKGQKGQNVFDTNEDNSSSSDGPTDKAGGGKGKGKGKVAFEPVHGKFLKDYHETEW